FVLDDILDIIPPSQETLHMAASPNPAEKDIKATPPPSSIGNQQSGKAVLREEAASISVKKALVEGEKTEGKNKKSE
ncbi:hypothetical protein Tco_0235316, partial [Tanacetum coccineum]